MKVDGWDIDIVVQGYPGKSVCHGGLGWSTIVLLRGHGRVCLIDTGSFGMRPLLRPRLKARDLEPKHVTDLLLTHSHHDHSVNWPLFRHARIVIGADEMAWGLEQPWGETPVPEFYVRELDAWPTIRKVNDGEQVFPGMTAHLAPGHTPGCLVYLLKGNTHDVIFTGDAAKNRAELISRKTDMTYDPAVSAASIEMIWSFWRRRPGSILVPGHDMPMTQENGKTRYIGKREAAITSWYGDDMDTTTLFKLTVD
jgi:glyoxylase-like metal-dependent hydrolase (beta-lactamase superfamily II)